MSDCSLSMSSVYRRTSLSFMGKKPFIIGVAGGTASGKSTVCDKIIERLGQYDVEQQERRVVCVSQDSFYRELTPSESTKAKLGQFNFDHPDAFDYDLILKTLKRITAGEACEIPVYDFKTNARVEGEFLMLYPADVVLFEGILVFYTSEVRSLFDMKLFVDTDADTRLARRVLRDTKERARDLNKVLLQYTTLVKPAFEEFCLPTKKFADVIIPRGAENTVAIELIVQHIQDFLRSRTEAATAETPYERKRAVNFQLSPDDESPPGREFSRMRNNSEPALSRPH